MKQQQVRELLEDMSLEEKIGQLLQVNSAYYEDSGILTGPQNTAGYTEREVQLAGTVLGGIGTAELRKIQEEYMEKHPHHIPLIFMADIINGYRTIFPIPLAQGCSFDPELARQGAAVAAEESAAAGLHLTFSPMVDLVRDARWGRVMESTGEDVELNCRFAKAMVEGYQGEGKLSEKGKIAACVKHFAAYGAPTAGRDYNTVELSERTLRDDYLPSYQAAVDAGAATLMTSFNTLDRVPSSGNRKLLREILREEMGFDGVVISDWAAIEEMISHRVAKDRKEAARLAIEAGVDIDMMTGCYCRNLESLVREGSVSERLIDEAVLRILELKNRLGLFENPFKDADEKEEKEKILCEAHRKTARKAAADTFVLLKNDGILPLETERKTTALIGPHISNRWIYGGWSIFGRQEDSVSIKDAVNARGMSGIRFAKGSPILDNSRGLTMFGDGLDWNRDPEETVRLRKEAAELAAQSDQVVLALGEHSVQSGEAASRADISVPQVQMELFRAVCEVNPNVAVVLFTGRPLDIREISEKAKAVLVVWQPGTEGGNAVMDVLLGEVNPSAKLAMSFPYCVGQVPVFYSEFSTGRPYHGEDTKYLSRYLDIPNEPLYPFGFGLSYTEFEISGVRLDASHIRPGQELHASVTVKNTGRRTGKEVLQLYIQDVCASVARPVREMKDFVKIELKPGEEKEVTFTVREKMLAFTGIDGKRQSEPGEFRLWIGNSSRTDNGAEFVLDPAAVE